MIRIRHALAAVAVPATLCFHAVMAADEPSFSPPPGVEVKEEGPRKLKYYKIPNIPKDKPIVTYCT